LNERAAVQGNIMVVDDNPANLRLLEGMLREHGYDVRSFPRGRLALAAAENRPPDLILLDINMPEMNGYEVCERLKSTPSVADIPVIFLSALNAAEDKVKAFRSGSIDYIPKPFQVEEVEARVEIHLKLRRAQQAEHELLERTLRGAVGTLWELVRLTSPVLASRSDSIRDIVRWITQRMEIKDPWQYDLAATLCLMGCLALPEEVFERGYGGEDLRLEEDEMFRAHPETTARLLTKIPRLEAVAEMIRRQLHSEAERSVLAQSELGARMLQLALELDRRIYRGVALKSALVQVRLLRRFDSRLLDALEGYSPTQAGFDMRRLPIRELCTGMVLEQDVLSTEGNLLVLKEGTVLNETWIERLRNFARSRGAQELVNVRVPRFDGPRKI
jgi:CheY-like chemotaxis protein